MDVHQRLIDFHARHTGGADRVFAHADAGGRSSYQRLADAVPGDASAVLDLCCGDGRLLALLRPRVARCVGLDASPHELAAARARLPDAELVSGLAQDLPFADASFDAVTCHFALMLLDDVDRVVAEVVRVLRPGGVFAVVVGGKGLPTPSMTEVFAVLRELWRREPDAAPSLGDPRLREEAGLRAVLAPFASVDVEAYELVQDVPADELPSFLRVAYYPVDWLSDGARRELADVLELRRDVVATDGVARWSFPALLARAVLA